MLGDCLLHLEHHEMKQECWAVLLDYYLVEREAGRSGDVAKNRYKMEYESRALWAMARMR